MPALAINRPPTIDLNQGMVACKAGISLGNDVYFLIAAGVPTGGTGWVGPGSIVVDYTNFDIYMNTNTMASPTYTKKVD